MSLDYFRGSAFAFKELMRKALAEIDRGDGELKPVRWRFTTANPARTQISQFKARVLRLQKKAR
jgi:hypothetical protein